MKSNIKILKTLTIERPGKTFKGLEVEIDVDGKIKRECFTDANEVLTSVNGEQIFITKIKEKYDNTLAEREAKESGVTALPDKIIELTEFKDRVIE